MTKEDETAGSPEDNSLGRLLTLCDGVFAIAMTLLALDLKVPDLGRDASEKQLAHALSQHAGSYTTYVLTFYVVAIYWLRHRSLMKSVVTVHPVLVRDTLILLLFIAAMPFPASLLGTYGNRPIALAIYGAFSAAATYMLMCMDRHINRYHLADHDVTADAGYERRTVSWMNLAIFLLCIPGGFLLGSWGPLLLILLVVPNWVPGIQRARRRRAQSTA